MMNDLTGMEGRKLRMPSVSPLRVMGRVTGRQRGRALGINTIPFHFPASAFPVEMATPRPANLSSARLWEAMTICDSLLRGVHTMFRVDAGGGRCVWKWLWLTCTPAIGCVSVKFFFYTTKVPEWLRVKFRNTTFHRSFERCHTASDSSVCSVAILPEYAKLPSIQQSVTLHAVIGILNTRMAYPH